MEYYSDIRMELTRRIMINCREKKRYYKTVSNTNVHVSKYKLYMLWEKSTRPYMNWSELWGQGIPDREDSNNKPNMRTPRGQRGNGWGRGLRDHHKPYGIRALPLIIWEGRVLEHQQNNRISVNAGQGWKSGNRGTRSEPLARFGRQIMVMWIRVLTCTTLYPSFI